MPVNLESPLYAAASLVVRADESINLCLLDVNDVVN